MRRIIFYLFILLFGIGFSSCEKEVNGNFDPSTQLRSEEGDILNASMTYIHNGLEGKLGSSIIESEFLSVIYNYNGANYVFDNDALLRQWTYGADDRTNIRNTLDTMVYYQSFENKPNGDSEVSASLIPKGWLFRNKNQGGTTWPFRGHTYGSRNNTASSYAIILAESVLCDRTWWRGRKVWIFAIPGYKGNLDVPYNFDDRAESGWDI